MLCFSRITGTCYRKLHFGVFCLDRWDHQLSYYYFQSFLVAGAASESTPLSESALSAVGDAFDSGAEMRLDDKNGIRGLGSALGALSSVCIIGINHVPRCGYLG